MNDEEGSLTLSREDLYELVWSKPMTDLAKDFGISDVALAKRCRRLGIPAPGRGYWARVDAGQKPYRPKLPEREEKWRDVQALTIPAQPEANPEVSETKSDGESTSAIRARIAALSTTTSDSIINCLAAVKRTARQLKHPRRAEFVFERGERTGPIVSMDVSEATLDRACLLADRILRASESLGWTFVEAAPKEAESLGEHRTHGRAEPAASPPRETPAGQLLVAGEYVGLHIEERLRDELRQPTPAEFAREQREYGYRAPRKVRVATGSLRVARLDTYRSYEAPARLTWYDRGNTRVEEHLPEMLAAFHELALSIKLRRAEDERKVREYEEAERRRKDLEARQEANAALVKQLETDAGAWHRARYLRRYIRAARKALGTDSLHARFRDQKIDYLDWAEQYVDQLDPLRPAPRATDFVSRTTYYNDLDRMKAAFGRLLGGDWEDAWKFGAGYSRDRTRPSYYYQKSVFEIEAADEDQDV